jgi:methylmalonyl-CoA mutase N-terminal domain/subunit
VALRTQQIVAEETGAGSVVDPLGGSYYVEWLTEQLEEEAYRYFDKLDSAGGVLNAIKSGFMQREIADNSYRLSKRVEKKQDIIVGVNKYEVEEEPPIETLKINFRAQKKQVARLKQVKRERDEKKVNSLLEELGRTFEKEDENSIYPMMDAVMAYATLGEIVDAGRKVWGSWKEPQIV